MDRWKLLVVAAAVSVLAAGCSSGTEAGQIAAVRDVISSVVDNADDIVLEIIPSSGSGKDCYEIVAEGGDLVIRGSSPVALCYAFDRYLRYGCGAMVTWSGEHVDIPGSWPEYRESAESPYALRYFLNVCTFGYTAPYWDWDRWSEEIDWMALHGVNMPLASVASEAIAMRVWKKFGLTDEEIGSFFTGPAYLPWHRMGNINGFDGPLTADWHKDQIALQHKILDKMRALGMQSVAPAFAGFVPPAFMEKYPDAHVRQLEWGGFDKEYNVCVLSPDSEYFKEIGKLFVSEWEKEFGKAKYYLSDSFNEMKLPVEDGDTLAKHELLAQYGETIYSSIAAGNPDAVWVTQGWTFGYQHDFWDKASLAALLSRVPDDRMMIVDLANDYPKWVWHTEQTWKVHEGFYGKQWIYSYVPNFGGKVLPTGDLPMYASGSAEALSSQYSSTLAGFGSAPEGIENNEVVYELLADMGWTSETIDLGQWLGEYCRARYGYNGPEMQQAWELLTGSVYSSLYSYPRFTWQTVVPDSRRVSRHDINEDYGDAVRLFLSCSEYCGASELYRHDAVEFAATWLSEIADRHYEKALACLDSGKMAEADRQLAVVKEILGKVDRLLASHPDYSLSRWIGFARKAGEQYGMADKYESDAKRLITVWGGFQEDYAARLWSGLVSGYYIPRLEIYFSEGQTALDSWEEKWISTPSECAVNPYEDPVTEAIKLIDVYE